MVMEQSVPWTDERPAGAQAVLTTGLTKRFGNRVVVDDVALAIPAGSVCGLDPAGIVEMRSLIRSFAEDGITVLVSSHLISEIEQICDYVVMIRAGRLVHQGSVDVLRATQQAEFLIAPEHDADRERLAGLLRQAGCEVTASETDGVLLIRKSGLGAADVNRLAAHHGITLRQLAERTRSLERAFSR